MQSSNSFSIGPTRVGENAPCFIIAEAGVAHFGEFNKALSLVDLAVDSGADCVKFQVFDVDAMISHQASEWKSRLSSRALSFFDFERIKTYCEKKSILFLATPHDLPSLDFLIKLEVEAYKIGSGELRNWSFLEKIAAQGKPVFFSTGMYTLTDVVEAMEVLLSTGNSNIALLHCVTSYPTSPEDVNLRVINMYKEKFGGVIGFSDHTSGFHIPLAAVAMGAQVVEKHISLDFNVPNAQDWKVSCGPHDLSRFVNEIREIEAAFGRAEKMPTAKEIENMDWARKSLVATRDLRAGERIEEIMLSSKRPGSGISPDQIAKVIGRVLNINVPSDTLLKWDFFK
jgi:N-acetylneuraminate synthase/N,N'-diacetyllegionaminate synthase